MESQQKAYAYAFAVVCLWATVASAFKLTLRYLDVVTMLLLASLVSLAVLLVITAAIGRLRATFTCNRRDIARSAALGFLNPFFYYLVLFSAYSMLPAQEAQPLNQTWIILLPILSVFILGQRVRWWNLAAISIGFIGIIVISTHGNVASLSFGSPLGVALALFSAVIWSLFWIFNLGDKREEGSKLLLNFVFGSLYICIAASILILLQPSQIPIPFTSSLPWQGALGAVYIGIFEMGLTFFLWLLALRHSKTTAQVSMMIYLVPFVSLFFIHFTVGEDIALSTVAGLVLIVAGIIFQQYFERSGVKKNGNGDTVKDQSSRPEKHTYPQKDPSPTAKDQSSECDEGTGSVEDNRCDH